MDNKPRSEEVRILIEEAIVSGEFAPGARLEEQELAQRYNVSRTPIRETLCLLAAAGLVEMRPRQGAVVATLTIPKLIEMFQVMAELEGLCARNVSRRISPARLAELDVIHRTCIDTVKKGDAAAFYEANRVFHELIYTASNNQFLEETMRALRNRVAPYRRYVTYQPGRMIASIHEHERVLDAIRRGDGDSAHAAMRDHVNLLGDNFADFVSSFPFQQDSSRKRSA